MFGNFHFKRLEILSSIAKSKNALLFLGHHLNDQVETVFMRMTKNTGFWGSSGIKFFNHWFDTPVIRPFHQYTKNSITKTCKKYSIQFEVDASNFDIKFDRVKIRQTLGQIKNRKRLFKNIYLSSFFIGKIVNVIDEKISQMCSSNFPIHDLGFSVIDVPTLSNLNKSIALRVLMLIIKTVGGNKYYVKNKEIKLFEIFKYFFKNYLIYNFNSKNDNWQIFFSKKKNLYNLQNLSQNFIENKSNSYFADPFIYNLRKKTYIFFENFSKKLNRGHISFLDLENRKNIINIIKKPYHLSYPFILDYKNKIYLIPESSKKNQLQINLRQNLMTK